MSRYIILDIDEVLNSVHFRMMTPRADDLIDPHALNLFNYVANALNCKVILNSTWRLHYKEYFFKDETESLIFYQKFFQELGCSFELVAVTSFDAQGTMDKGAYHYIIQHDINPSQVIVLDDSIHGDYPLHYVAPDAFCGLTVHDIADIFHYFEPNHDWLRTYHAYTPYMRMGTSELDSLA